MTYYFMDNNKQNQLNNLRHSCAHLLAAAVLKFYPDAKPTIGPSIDEGFYYDFDFDNVKISEDDLPKIEEEMKKMVKSWDGFERIEKSSDQAIEYFKNNPYKLELIEELIQKGEKITFYKSGDFIDLCRGGHTPYPKSNIKHFKLLSIAGAYWRGDEKNKMLTRIYGTAFPTKDELEKYLWQKEEAKKRDHRKLGAELELFTFDDMVGPGLVLWLPKGTIIREELERFAKKTEKAWGYQRVATPHLAKKILFETSGHLPYYKESMYPGMKLDDGEYYLKAMNCPAHHLIYRSKPRSYKDLPIRLAEYGTVYRYELSGTLAGLLRVRGMTMNDSHIYCRKDQIKSEFLRVVELHKYYYKVFGITDYYMRLSLHDPKNKSKYIDEPDSWSFSENAIREVLKESKLPFIEKMDEAAFYGPKVDFQIKSVIGREESISTVQLDFAAKKRFNLNYIDNDGKEKEVYVIHRAPLGTHERFIAFLIEHYAGKFPLWLSPVQLTLIPISEKHVDTSRIIADHLISKDFRVEVDDRNERMQAKIRDATLQKVPFIGIIGDKEIERFDAKNPEEALISLRKRDEGDLGQNSISEILQTFQKELE